MGAKMHQDIILKKNHTLKKISFKKRKTSNPEKEKQTVKYPFERFSCKEKKQPTVQHYLGPLFFTIYPPLIESAFKNL